MSKHGESPNEIPDSVTGLVKNFCDLVKPITLADMQDYMREYTDTCDDIMATLEDFELSCEVIETHLLPVASETKREFFENYYGGDYEG